MRKNTLQLTRNEKSEYLTPGAAIQQYSRKSKKHTSNHSQNI